MPHIARRKRHGIEQAGKMMTKILSEAPLFGAREVPEAMRNKLQPPKLSWKCDEARYAYSTRLSM